MFAKIVILCAALAAAHGSALFAAPLVNTGVSVESRQQDSLGNYAYAYDISVFWVAYACTYIIRMNTGSINSKAEVRKMVHSPLQLSLLLLAYAAPAVLPQLPTASSSTPPLQLCCTPVTLAAPVAYGGALGHAGVLGLGYGVGLGHGAAYGLGYGAGLLGAGHGKLLI
ncbi:hypothetical protein AVEN_36309-1 [Araneus ventricosus]|uniref:Uncharacterized protein n=1 Tax=Araneus ventricosus TaxID=182803 RepID=A0A4Y2QF65_ARAVE|nr:hypothetical protein AVEN_36309-1 [Araneus ventricosus]